MKGPDFVPADGTAFVASPKGRTIGCVCCSLVGVAVDDKNGLCRDCWRAWRFSSERIISKGGVLR
jgi:hypothetical protein